MIYLRQAKLIHNFPYLPTYSSPLAASLHMQSTMPSTKWPAHLPTLDTSSRCWQRLEKVFAELDRLVEDYVAYVDTDEEPELEEREVRRIWPKERPDVADISLIEMCIRLFERKLKKYALLLEKQGEEDDLPEGCYDAVNGALDELEGVHMYLVDDPLQALDCMKMAIQNWESY